MSFLTATMSKGGGPRAAAGARWEPRADPHADTQGRDRPRPAAGALHVLPPARGEAGGAALPALATPGDLREAVQYLKRRPAGVSPVEALADSKRRAFTPRKVEAYESWGLVARRGERLLLTPLGLRFARTLEPEARFYRRLLDSNPLYRAALGWVRRQGLDVVTHGDVAAFLREHAAQTPGQADAKATEEGVVCFFHLCQAAELGTLTIGKRGQPSRLRVEHEGLADYFEGLADHVDGTAVSAQPRTGSHGGASGRGPAPEGEESDAPSGAGEDSTAGTRLFITYGVQPPELVAQIQTVFELAGVRSHASERKTHAGGAVLVADDAVELMRRCDAALILLSKEDCRPDAGGAPAVDERALVEIGAACVLYERRVLLLLDGPFGLPAGLAALPHVTLGEGGLTWEVGIELLKTVRGFAERARQD